MPVFSGGLRVKVLATSVAADEHLESGWRLYDERRAPRGFYDGPGAGMSATAHRHGAAPSGGPQLNDLDADDENCLFHLLAA